MRGAIHAGGISIIAWACSMLLAATATAQTADSVISITSGPSGETTSRDATFSFAPAGGATIGYTTCDLDGAGATTCTSPVAYSGLGVGAHRFIVRAFSSRGGALGSDARSWTIVAAPPPPTPPPPPPPPPPVSTKPVPQVLPDFFLARAPYTPGPGLKLPVKTVVLKPKSTGSSPIAVVRIGASKGDLTYSFSTLAPGVNAFVFENDATNPTTLTVNLFATSAAKPVSAKVTLTATPTSPQVGPAPRSIVIPYLVVEEYDLAIAGIDVTQGIQLPQSTASALPARDPSKPAAPVSYPSAVNLQFKGSGSVAGSLVGAGLALEPLSGAAPLVQRKKTTVNVYAVRLGPAGLKGATLLLHGRGKNGAALPYSPLKPQNSPALSPGDPNAVPLSSVKSKQGAFTFILPSVWTDRPWLELEAELLPPKLYGKAECSLPACLQNNHFTLTNVQLYDTGHLEVWPLGFPSLTKFGPLDDPPSTFKLTGRALPLADDDLRVGGEYRAYYNGDVSQKTMLATVKAFVNDLPTACKSYFIAARPANCPDLVAGVRQDGIPGLSAGGEDVYPPRPGMTVVNQARPLTSVGHEIVHALGFKHADTACGGNSDDQVSEPWWPDPWGLLYGITAGGKVNGGGNVGTAGTSTGASWYDFMSYCADTNGDPNSWLSIINYRRAFDGLRNLQKVRVGAVSVVGTLAAQPGAALSVIGYVEGDAVAITRIRPKAGEPELGPADSAYRLVLRDAAGATLADAPMVVDETDGHGPGTSYVSADVPLPGTSPGALPKALYSVEVVSKGSAVARVVRSPHAPTVQLLAPNAGQRVGGGPAVVTRWNAHDADGDALTTALDYSIDDGATWRTIAAGVEGGTSSLPSRLLTASKRARLRVRVSDGLDETTATSGRLVSLGAPPLVRITTPEGRSTITALDAMLLEARAYDDAFRPLRGRALTWFDGKREIASGETTTAPPLQPGLHRIRLVARDSAGRRATDTVVVRVRAVAPRLIVRSAPARLSPRAHVLRLRVAATIPAVVTARGSAPNGGAPRWQIGTRTRTISIPVVPGTGRLRLVLRAEAHGHVSTLGFILPRSR